MPTIVGILTSMSKIKFMVSGVEHDKCFITPRPGIRNNVRGEKFHVAGNLRHVSWQAFDVP